MHTHAFTTRHVAADGIGRRGAAAVAKLREQGAHTHHQYAAFVVRRLGFSKHHRVIGRLSLVWRDANRMLNITH